MGGIQGISCFSAFPRIDAQASSQTVSGAIVTVVGVAVAAVLFMSEMNAFRNPGLVEEMLVDTSTENSLRIAFNLTVPHLPCAAISVDTGDLSGAHETDTRFAKHLDIHKIRLDSRGSVILAKGKRKEYMAPVSIEDYAFGRTASANLKGTLEHVRDIDEEMEHHEGCNVFGYIDSKRIAGKFHLSVHLGNFMMMADTQRQIAAAKEHHKLNGTRQMLPDLHRIDVSHTIHSLAFGAQFPGQINPLDGVHRGVKEGTGTFKYFLKIVPTEYKRSNGVTLKTNQFSVTEYYVPNNPEQQMIPALDFIYDISPIIVSISEQQLGLVHFIVRLCAVVGGVFATTGVVDRMLRFSEPIQPGSPIAH